ncbi:MAG TPA: hypothetical protein PLW86_07175, partial [Rhodocyclaceae bacterium]|nr:hypothetical protein [Rhodocyclaceae bacterium]
MALIEAGCSLAWAGANRMLSLISMVTPRLVSSNLTLPSRTSGASTSMMSLATFFILSRSAVFSVGGTLSALSVGLAATGALAGTTMACPPGSAVTLLNALTSA